MVSFSLGFQSCCKTFAHDQVASQARSFPQNKYILILQGMMLFQRDLDNVCLVALSWNPRFNISKCVGMKLGVYNADNWFDCNYIIDRNLLKIFASYRVFMCLHDYAHDVV